MLQIPVQNAKANQASTALNPDTKSNVSRDPSGLNRSVLQIFKKNVFGR